MFKKGLLAVIGLTSACLLTSCARSSDPQVDPYEGFNRAMFGFNRFVDKIALKPISIMYNFITPAPLQQGISNIFDNIGEITTLPNDILQGKVKYAFLDIWRFLINSTLGVGGLFDVASKIGLPKHYEDFGMTLAYWEGNKTQSPYLMLPILGPATFRSGFGKIFDIAASPWPYIDNCTVTWTAFGLQALNVRSRLLPADQLIDTSFDPYIFVRNAYLQKRAQMLKQNEDNDKYINNKVGHGAYMSAGDYGVRDDGKSTLVDDDVADAPIDMSGSHSKAAIPTPLSTSKHHVAKHHA